MTGTSIGYFLNDLMAPEILRLVIFITPIYILLLLMNAQQSSNRLAAVLGGRYVRLSMASQGTGQFYSPALLAAVALSPCFSCERAFYQTGRHKWLNIPCLKPI